MPKVSVSGLLRMFLACWVDVGARDGILTTVLTEEWASNVLVCTEDRAESMLISVLLQSRDRNISSAVAVFGSQDEDRATEGHPSSELASPLER